MKRNLRWFVAPVFVAVMGAALAQDATPPPRPGRGEVPWGTARELTELARELEDRKRLLDRREAAIAEREADLTRIEGTLSTRMDALTALRDEVSSMLDDLEVQSDDRIEDLVRRVEAMRDTQAAAMLAETERDLAVEVLRRMTPSKAGKALAKMDPVKAADLGEGLAARVDIPELP